MSMFRYYCHTKNKCDGYLRSISQIAESCLPPPFSGDASWCSVIAKRYDLELEVYNNMGKFVCKTKLWGDENKTEL